MVQGLCCGTEKSWSFGPQSVQWDFWCSWSLFLYGNIEQVFNKGLWAVVLTKGKRLTELLLQF